MSVIKIGQQQQLAECTLPLLLAKGSARKQNEEASSLVIDLLKTGGSAKVEIYTLVPKNEILPAILKGNVKPKETRKQHNVKIGHQQQIAESALPLLLAKG